MSIRINVDPTNPGQFFACCGLLELADRFWGGAQGFFADRQFRVECDGTLDLLLACLVANQPVELTTLPNGLEVKPLIAPLVLSFDYAPEHPLTLDAWMKIAVEKQGVVAAANPPWNFWSGQQTAFRIWRDLRNALADQLEAASPNELTDLFMNRVLLSGRFGFDPGAAWNALDVGFSPNEQGMEVESSPAVELLAAVGIQRFRPRVSNNRLSFLYVTWGHPLPPSIASAAVAGAIMVPPMTCFYGRVISRGSYAALGQSTPANGGVCDE